ncbi:GNAT family N-acetyltransferase [Candidatus Neomarinimicrobiota bacterium]
MTTKAAQLIPLNENLVDQLIKWRSQPEAQQHQPITSMSREHLQKYLKSRGSENLAELANTDYILIIRDEELGKDVGWMTLEIMSRLHGLARIGYTISNDLWNQGYATAAVRTLVNQLFRETSIQRVEADCSVNNPASRRVLENCGFRLVGIKRKYLIIKEQRIDHFYFELTRDDFLAG